VGSKVRIQFSDNGPGTPKEHLTKIFTTSFTTRGDDNGIEFDLSISYGIIKEHGGEIWVESEVGKGTSYFIELPISTTKFEKDVKEKPIAQSVNEKEEKGLLIDDEAHIIDLLSKFLAMEGYPTEKVTDGRLALEKLGRNSYDFILCDIKIPEIDGMTLYQELKERKSPNLDKIIFITGDAISTDIQAFLKSAQRPYLSKPFELMDVKKTIQQLITNTQTRH
jgi:CheY-like chemotaxis protein